MVAGALLALALLEPAPTATAAAPPRLQDVLALAGRYVARLEEELAVLVADETYAQRLYVGPDSSARQLRSLVSDVAWVPTGELALRPGAAPPGQQPDHRLQLPPQAQPAALHVSPRRRGREGGSRDVEAPVRGEAAPHAHPHVEVQPIVPVP